MQTEDWRIVEELFHAARELKGEERRRFLEERSGSNKAIRRMIDKLLEDDITANSFLDSPAVELVSETFPPGTTIGPYEIIGLAGVGGMGQVYRARDTRLKRDVAMKVLPPRFVVVPDRVARFQRESTMLASLNHPNLGAIYDILQTDGICCLVLEYVEGKTLAKQLDEGPIPIEETLRIARQIAAALEIAHGKGIVHRDLKPANIMITPDGKVKVLDFGLAKAFAGLFEPELQDPAPAAVNNTAVDMSLVQGTVGYMSPEQAGGARVDRRTDIWAFGCVLFEMLTGKKASSAAAFLSTVDGRHAPFAGATVTRPASEAATLRSLPAPSTVAPWLPKEIDAPLLTTLCTNPEGRPSSAEDVVRQITTALNHAAQRTWRKREIPRRLVVGSLLSVVLALLSPFAWDAAPVRRLEAMTVDFRFGQLTPQPADPRVLIVSIDDASLNADATPLAAKADEFGRQIERIFQAGARGVAVDLLLPAPWSRSEIFSQMVLHRADALTLAAMSTAVGAVVGPECVSPLAAAALGPERFSELFAFVNVQEDDDGVIRRGYLSFEDQSGSRRKAFAMRAAQSMGATLPEEISHGQPFWIDWSVDTAGFEKLSWKDLNQALDGPTSIFGDRLVIVGAEFAGSGDEVHSEPNRTARLSGTVLQAMMMDTILRGLPIREPPRLGDVAMLILISGVVMSSVLCVRSLHRAALVTLAGSVLWVAGCVVLFVSSRVLILTVGPAMSIIAAGAMGFILRWQLPAFPKLSEDR
jgi:serine/threonine protein kinase